MGEKMSLQQAMIVTPEMIREAEAHLPFDVKTSGNLARWEWLAAYLTRALAEPNKPCECCGATPQGDVVERPALDLPLTSREEAEQIGREDIKRAAFKDLKPVLVDVAVENAPLGTKAPATIGGHWCRVPGGWKWNGPGGNGGTFPRPGGDWNGQLILPEFRA